MDNLDSAVTPPKTLTSRALMAGLIIAAITNVIALIIYVAGLNEVMMTNKPLSWLNNLLSLGITFYFIHVAIRTFRDQDNSGYLSVGQGIGLGTLAGLVAGVIGAIWIYIFMTYIAPDMLDTIKRVSMEQMQQSGQSEEQVEQAMEMTSMFFSPAIIALMVPFFSTFLGFLSGLVSGLIQKKDRTYA